MPKKFNYKDSLTNIKASLFDIYEDQEQKIGSLDDSIKQEYVNDFIEIKDLALTLLEKIEMLYHTSIDIDESDETIPSFPSDTTSDEDSYGEEVRVPIDSEDTLTDDFEEESIESTDEEIDEDNIENGNLEEHTKYYLLCDETKLNFAYVPEPLLIKLKEYRSEDDDVSFDESISLEEDSGSEDVSDADPSLEQEDTGKLYKKDELTAKGIIVRNDQYMKLALSKHRQKGVLEEAKAFLLETEKKNRQKTQEVELEKAKVHLDI